MLVEVILKLGGKLPILFFYISSRIISIINAREQIAMTTIFAILLGGGQFYSFHSMNCPVVSVFNEPNTKD